MESVSFSFKVVLQELVPSRHGELVSVVGLPLLAARVVVIVSCLWHPRNAWVAVQALSDLGILPADMETENTDRGSGLRLETDGDVKVLAFLSRNRRARNWPDSHEHSSLSPVVWEKLDRFARCFADFRSRLRQDVSRRELLGDQLSAMLRSHVDERWLSEAWDDGRRRDADDLAAVVRVALRAALPARNVAFVLASQNALVLLGTGACFFLSFSCCTWCFMLRTT